VLPCERGQPPPACMQAKVNADQKAGFFAIASAPLRTDGTVELLIKTQPGSAAEAINALPAGGSVLVSAAQGKGFPIDKIPTSDVDTVLMVRGQQYLWPSTLATAAAPSKAHTPLTTRVLLSRFPPAVCHGLWHQSHQGCDRVGTTRIAQAHPAVLRNQGQG
jgi:hypothetical protein